jgi:hypothetical protein
MADGLAALEEGLKQGLDDLQKDPVAMAILESRTWDQVFEVARNAVRLAVAPILWDRHFGPMVETAEVCKVLDVSRQAVAKAVDAGRLIALPAGRTRRYPIWQFGPGEIRHEVAEIIASFSEVYPEVRPAQIASWAMTPQPELHGDSPADWMQSGKDLGPVLLAAERAAWALAQ